MADGRKNNGGARAGAGRKPKADEIKLIENLDKAIDQDYVFKKLHHLFAMGEMSAIRLYFEYRFGKPKQQLDIDATVETEPVTIIIE